MVLKILGMCKCVKEEGKSVWCWCFYFLAHTQTAADVSIRRWLPSMYANPFFYHPPDSGSWPQPPKTKEQETFFKILVQMAHMTSTLGSLQIHMSVKEDRYSEVHVIRKGLECRALRKKFK